MSIEKAVTNSERGRAHCPVLHLLEYGLALDLGERSRPLMVGDLFHAAMEGVWEQPQGNGAEADQRITNGIIALRKRANQLRDEAYRFDVHEIDPYMTTQSHVSSQVDEADDFVSTMVEHYSRKWKDTFPHVNTVLLANEERVCVPTVFPDTGRSSSRTWYAMRMDKLVELHNPTGFGVWLVEHKTSSSALEDWVRNNQSSPQALSYAWAIGQKYGLQVQGVLYDLAYTGARRAPEATKCGTRLRKVGKLPSCTWRDFAAAVLRLHAPNTTVDPATAGHGVVLHAVRDVVATHTKPSTVAWYEETLMLLAAREADGYWFRRQLVPFSKRQIDDMGRELYYALKPIRRNNELAAPSRELMHSDVQNGVLPAKAVSDAFKDVLHNHPETFYRNHSACIGRYGRLCKWSAFCHSPTPHQAADIRMRPARHAELAEE